MKPPNYKNPQFFVVRIKLALPMMLPFLDVGFGNSRSKRASCFRSVLFCNFSKLTCRSYKSNNSDINLPTACALRSLNCLTQRRIVDASAAQPPDLSTFTPFSASAITLSITPAS